MSGWPSESALAGEAGRRGEEERGGEGKEGQGRGGEGERDMPALPVGSALSWFL